jgi:ribonuclease T2
MLYHPVRRAAAIAFSFAFLFAFAALAIEADQNKHNRFDFYVLALSWSPTYCESAKQRASGRKPSLQCSGRPFAFVVHGLWPQYTQGFPSYCQVPAPRVDAKLVNAMLDLMPSRSLIFHEWSRHGTCSGLSAQDYFDTLRKARAAVTIPAAYRDPVEPQSVSPGEVAAAFIKANPGLSADAMAVSCNKMRLTEVRLCLGKDLSFHDCAAIAHRNCRRDKVVMPAVRGK